eukprot:TRINITY_DN2168_c2_g1_i1.p1 TRINITY_DN2168_c2_g1~~TRINITY_DN2168_c2_g1_i1.p1  ORF type:complete len:1122 (-),score=390.07 TRINITY_DN2168_c2_g1_i1:144-3485(-)
MERDPNWEDEADSNIELKSNDDLFHSTFDEINNQRFGKKGEKQSTEPIIEFDRWSRAITKKIQELVRTDHRNNGLQIGQWLWKIHEDIDKKTAIEIAKNAGVSISNIDNYFKSAQGYEAVRQGYLALNMKDAIDELPEGYTLYRVLTKEFKSYPRLCAGLFYVVKKWYGTLTVIRLDDHVKYMMNRIESMTPDEINAMSNDEILTFLGDTPNAEVKSEIEKSKAKDDLSNDQPNKATNGHLDLNLEFNPESPKTNGNHLLSEEPPLQDSEIDGKEEISEPNLLEPTAMSPSARQDDPKSENDLLEMTVAEVNKAVLTDKSHLQVKKVVKDMLTSKDRDSKTTGLRIGLWLHKLKESVDSRAATKVGVESGVQTTTIPYYIRAAESYWAARQGYQTLGLMHELIDLPINHSFYSNFNKSFKDHPRLYAGIAHVAKKKYGLLSNIRMQQCIRRVKEIIKNVTDEELAAMSNDTFLGFLEKNFEKTQVNSDDEDTEQGETDSESEDEFTDGKRRSYFQVESDDEESAAETESEVESDLLESINGLTKRHQSSVPESIRDMIKSGGDRLQIGLWLYQLYKDSGKKTAVELGAAAGLSPKNIREYFRAAEGYRAVCQGFRELNLKEHVSELPQCLTYYSTLTQEFKTHPRLCAGVFHVVKQRHGVLTQVTVLDHARNLRQKVMQASYEELKRMSNEEIISFLGGNGTDDGMDTDSEDQEDIGDEDVDVEDDVNHANDSEMLQVTVQEIENCTLQKEDQQAIKEKILDIMRKEQKYDGLRIGLWLWKVKNDISMQSASKMALDAGITSQKLTLYLRAAEGYWTTRKGAQELGISINELPCHFSYYIRLDKKFRGHPRLCAGLFHLVKKRESAAVHLPLKKQIRKISDDTLTNMSNDQILALLERALKNSKMEETPLDKPTKKSMIALRKKTVTGPSPRQMGQAKVNIKKRKEGMRHMPPADLLKVFVKAGKQQFLSDGDRILWLGKELGLDPSVIVNVMKEEALPIYTVFFEEEGIVPIIPQKTVFYTEEVMKGPLPKKIKAPGSPIPDGKLEVAMMAQDDMRENALEKALGRSAMEIVDVPSENGLAIMELDLQELVPDPSAMQQVKESEMPVEEKKE